MDDRFYSPMKDKTVTISGGGLTYIIEAQQISLNRVESFYSDILNLELTLEACTMTVKFNQTEEEVPALHKEDLVVLTQVFDHLESLSTVPGLFAAEIRVKVDDVASWAVIGWSESGDPAILRFEKDNER